MRSSWSSRTAQSHFDIDRKKRLWLLLAPGMSGPPPTAWDDKKKLPRHEDRGSVACSAIAGRPAHPVRPALAGLVEIVAAVESVIRVVLVAHGAAATHL